jgi:transposase
MLNMSKKNGARAPREPTAAELREGSRSDATPGPATGERPLRRRFTAKYKLDILREVDKAQASGESGAVGALLRREGLYSSHLASWRRQRERGELAGLSPKKRGRKPAPKNPLADEVARLQRQNARLQAELDKAKVVIDVQKKVAALLGNPIPENPTEET